MHEQDIQGMIDRRWGESGLIVAIPSVMSASELPSVVELTMTLEYLPVAVFVDSSPVICIFGNRACRQLSGNNNTDIDTKFWPKLTETGMEAQVANLRERLWNHAEPYSITTAAITSTGIPKWLWTQVIPITDSSGKVLRAIGTIIDVTERVKSMNLLEKSEQQFRALVTNTADAIIGIDSKQCIQVWNETAVQMFGYEQHEIIGKPITVLIPSRLAPSHADLVSGFAHGDAARIAMTGRSVRALRKDGSEFDVEVGIAKVQLGEAKLSVATVRDVSERERILAERQASDNKFRALVQHSVDSIFVVGPDAKISYVSPASEETTGYRPDELLGLDSDILITRIHREDQERVQGVADQVRSDPQGHETIVYRQQHKAGDFRTLEARLTNYLNVDGLNSLVINVRDISEKIAMEAELKERNGELTAILAAFPDQLYRVSPDGHVIESLTDNDTGAIESATLVGRPLIDILPNELGRRVTEVYSRVAFSGAAETFEYTAKELELSGDGSYEARLSPLPDGNVLSSVRDISERVRMEKLLSFQALHDALTGLPNRQLMASKLEEALEASPSNEGHVGVLFLDLDGFKRVNDGLGHAAGDELLIQVAARLNSAVRPQDVVARIGGDEFVIVSSNLRDLAEAELVAERIRHVLDSPILVEDTEVTVSASIGIAIAGPQTCDAESLITNADAAMYQAKERGRARSEVFDDDMQDFLNRRIVLEAELRNALALGEIEIRFKAIADAVTGKITGAQATASWVHPHHGEIPPSEFMAIAEEAGLSGQISGATIDQAIEGAAKWLPQTLGTPILSIGLSLKHLIDPKFRSKTLKILESSGIDPESLCFEISGAAALRSDNKIVSDLKELRQLGIKIAIDDFGTGYSSLSSLRSLPISCIKIDSGLVAGLEDGRADAAIVRSTIDLAHQFGLWVVAKGVNTAEQMMLLRSMGCDSMQGNLISDPLTPEAFAELLAKDGRW